MAAKKTNVKKTEKLTAPIAPPIERGPDAKKGGDPIRQLKETLAFVGKELTTLRRSHAVWSGTTSRLEDEVKVLTETSKDTAAKLRKLIADPIYSVPEKLKREVDALTAKLVVQSTKHNDLVQSLADFKKVVVGKRGTKAGAAKDSEATTEAIASGAVVLGSLKTEVDSLNHRLTDLEGEFGSLATELGHVPTRGTVAIDGTPVQTTIEEAIERTKTEPPDYHGPEVTRTDLAGEKG